MTNHGASGVHDQLYEQALQELQRKEYKLQAERARREEKELEGCSFKPQLNNTSKYYIDKILGKRVNDKIDEAPLQ